MNSTEVKTPAALEKNDYSQKDSFDTRKFKKFFKARKPTKPKDLSLLFGFDIETAGNLNEFVCATFVNDEHSVTLKTIEDVVTFLDEAGLAGYHIVATNLGFDFLGTLFEYRERWKIMERNGVIYGFTWYITSDKKKKVEFIDTIRFFPAPVTTLGKIIDVPKLPHPSCFGKHPKNEKEWNDLIKYCENDAYISYKFTKDFIFRYINENGLELKKTCASISLCDFRTNYFDEQIMVEPPIVHERVFKAYYGGRTEVFRRGYFGKKDSNEINVYDVNSLYPSVMLNELPDPNTAKPVQEIKWSHIERYEGVAYIEAYQHDTFIPVLPLRTPDKLIFPTGVIRGYYTFIEIREAVKHGLEIKKFGDGVLYSETKPYFREFILDKYHTRQKQKKVGDPMELMTKLIMNSLYGKFAFNYREQSEMLNSTSMDEKSLENAYKVIQVAPEFFSILKRSDDPPSYSFPIWSCYITAYARLKLFSYLHEYQDDLLYCDTDSIFLCNGRKMSQSDELGDMKLEYSCDTAIIVRPKFYYTQYAKIKGVKNVKTFQEFNQIMHQPLVKQERFTKFRTAIRSQTHHRSGKLKINQITQHTKRLGLNDSKRQWHGDFEFMGNETSKPIHMTKEKLIEYGVTDEFLRVEFPEQ